MTAVDLAGNSDSVLEQIVGEAHLALTEQPLSLTSRQLVVQALNSLDLAGSWLDNERLARLRASYFFNPRLVNNSEQLVFCTNLLHLRDILENNEINSYLHGPVTLVSPPLAHYILRKPVRIFLDLPSLKILNRDEWGRSVGGLLIFPGDVRLSPECIDRIEMWAQKNKPETEMAIEAFSRLDTNIYKMAITQKSEGVWLLERGIERALQVGFPVNEKRTSLAGTVTAIQPGDTGLVTIEFADGNKKSVLKLEFDRHFSVTASRAKQYKVKLNAQQVELTGDQIANAIRSKLTESQTVKNIFEMFDVPAEKMIGLKIRLAPLKAKYAETDANEMVLNEALFSERRDFFSDYFFVCVHELVHFLARLSGFLPEIKGKKYFADQEEVLGMIVACAYMLEINGDLESFYNKAIKWHFHDDETAKKAMKQIMAATGSLTNQGC